MRNMFTRCDLATDRAYRNGAGWRKGDFEWLRAVQAAVIVALSVAGMSPQRMDSAARIQQ